jgi:predicted ATPase
VDIATWLRDLDATEIQAPRSARHDPIVDRSLVHQAGFHPLVLVQAHLGFVLSCLGYSDQAEASITAAIVDARTLTHQPSLALALSWGIGLSLIQEDAIPGARVFELVSVAAEQGFPYWRAYGTIYQGWFMVANGDLVKGIPLLRAGLAAYRSTGAALLTSHHTALLGRACEIAGQVEEASALFDEALRIVEKTGERWFAAKLNRLKGQLLLRQGQSEAAEDLYHEALGIARKQEAKLWELRASVSLARLRRDQGRRIEARALLAPIYDCFTEGFDKPDLKDAKALLDELG